MYRRLLLCCLFLADVVVAFQIVPSPTKSALHVSFAQKEKKTAWDQYTEGEYGQVFKFPWEEGVEATDKTAIGHIIPVVVAVALIGGARLQQMGALPL